MPLRGHHTIIAGSQSRQGLAAPELGSEKIAKLTRWIKSKNEPATGGAPHFATVPSTHQQAGKPGSQTTTTTTGPTPKRSNKAGKPASMNGSTPMDKKQRIRALQKPLPLPTKTRTWSRNFLILHVRSPRDNSHYRAANGRAQAGVSSVVCLPRRGWIFSTGGGFTRIHHRKGPILPSTSPPAAATPSAING